MMEQIQGYFEKRFVKDAESIIINRRSTLSGMLNKFPYWWIDGIFTTFKQKMQEKGKSRELLRYFLIQIAWTILFNSLPRDSQKALTFIKEKGGVVKYRDIVKKCPDGANFDWEKEPPNLPVGLLRRHVLAIVGKMLINNRFYKVILIPKEILQIFNSRDGGKINQLNNNSCHQLFQ